MIVLFAGGEYFSWFYLKGLVSENFDKLSFFEKIIDYLRHITLPVLSMTIGGLASLCFLTRNAFLDELGKQYVTTARAKGLSENAVLYKMKTTTPQELAKAPDVSEGVENRIVAAAKQASSLDELYALAKTKRYSHARIRRIIIHSQPLPLSPHPPQPPNPIFPKFKPPPLPPLPP